MFEIGKWYWVWLIEGGDEGQSSYKVVDYQAPLLRLHNPHMGEDMIVNTSSPMFVRAQLSPHQGERPVLEFPE
ncbi:hypothetical protein [Mesorhizobium retamae]|uniref:Uncharacterized protein n=1 Tax=Mesorhizobium retamae TaxID=2912854 RepID=A0ABS9Q9H9_9HYPH|nr:hypothetical protein [Mesorhizobium sp. IRAMC:0171]MCG7504068.1 hypothetical protein [Mesorhizobium sp. IRAMC:0171]